MEIEVESQEEEYFCWYIHELQKAGYIKSWKYQPRPFLLSDKVTYKHRKQLKTKQKILFKTLLQPHQYQADFLINWNATARGIFFGSDLIQNILSFPFVVDQPKTGFLRSVVDVKGTFNQNDAWRRFSIEQKWVWQKYQIYVQKIIPVKLFEKSFTPARYLFTDKKTKHRKLKYVPVSLNQFITGK